ncbi:MAG: signal peptidase I [Planctomycetota bacterium]|nr:signal peptidase I [Planctomycetota bacterium]
MPKTNSKPKAGSSSTDKPGDAKDRRKSDLQRPQSGWRETVESVVVAFILAFLFRTFEAEAFVIPTGSMAPTLYGRHKSCVCDECGFEFAIGASDEVDRNGFYVPANRIQEAYCSNCGFKNPVKDLPAFKGDRILVNKFPFEFATPSRFDVVVFKFPEEPKTNYIKRLVGLPGEKIKIERGDLFAWNEGDHRYDILRKDDPNKQRVLQILVNDDGHRPKRLQEAGWPLRWAGMVEDPGDDNSIAGWVEDPNGWAGSEGNSYTLKGAQATNGEFRWLRYRHFVPNEDDWQRVKQDDAPRWEPRPQLIADSCGYNAFTSNNNVSDFGYYWVGDLTLSCRCRIDEPTEDAVVRLELVEGLRWYRCEIRPKTGDVRLYYVDNELDRDDPHVEKVASGKCDVVGGDTYDLEFANVDDRLTLWVDGGLVEFDAPTTVKHPDVGFRSPTDRDLIPLAIAAHGVDLNVSRLTVKRDIYYRGESFVPQRGMIPVSELGNTSPLILSDLLTHPTDPNPENQIYGWGHTYKTAVENRNQEYGEVVFELTKDPKNPEFDEFLVLGDNSPRSKDSRLWTEPRVDFTHRHSVPRKALIGKAFFIYWPHGVPFMNGGNGYPLGWHHDGQHRDWSYPSWRLPFYPQVWRMSRIR